MQKDNQNKKKKRKKRKEAERQRIQQANVQIKRKKNKIKSTHTYKKTKKMENNKNTTKIADKKNKTEANKTALFTQNNTIYYLDCNKFRKQHSIPASVTMATEELNQTVSANRGEKKRRKPTNIKKKENERKNNVKARKLNECESIKHEYPNQNNRQKQRRRKNITYINIEELRTR